MLSCVWLSSPHRYVHLVYLSLKIVAGLVGVVASYSGLFLYEDEEGKVTTRLEEWWVGLQDKEKSSLSMQSAFLKEIASLAGRFFDRLLGKRLLSKEAFASLYCYSAGVGILAWATIFRGRHVFGFWEAGEVLLGLSSLSVVLFLGWEPT